LVNESLNKK